MSAIFLLSPEEWWSLASVETQMQVSCQAAATLANRSGELARGRAEMKMVPIHKKRAAVFRQIAEEVCEQEAKEEEKAREEAV